MQPYKMNKKKFRVVYKNITITYNNCFEVELKDFKAFFIGLFEKIYTTNTIKYLLVAKNKTDKTTTVLLILDKKPNFKSIDNFIINDDKPIFEPLKGTIKTFEKEIKDDNDFEWIESGKSSTIINAIPEQNAKELEEQFYNYVDNLRERFWHVDKNMTTEDASKEIDVFFVEKPPKEKYKRIAEIERILKKYFTREKSDNILDEDDIEDYNTFQNDLPVLINLKKDILEQIETVKKRKRPHFICAEGGAQIGKTQFIISCLTHHKIKFNWISGKLRFDNYNDNANVDIYDDSNYYFWDKNPEGIEYAKRIIGCNHKKMGVWKNKYQPLLTLNKNKLSIIICNPGKDSFFNWAFSEKNKHKKYIEECKGIFYNFGNQKLYITKAEQEEKNRIYKNAIQPNENRESIETKTNNLAIKLFGKDKVEFID